MSGRSYLQDLLTYVAGHKLLPHRFRPAFLRGAGGRIGRRVLIYSDMSIHGDLRLTVEDDVFINQGCHIDTQASVRIRSGARIGDHVRLITSDHEIGPSERRAGRGRSAPIEIGRGAWVCSGATVLPGVHVADGCIIAAGAVVLKSTEPDGLYAGVPARRVRTLTERIS